MFIDGGQTVGLGDWAGQPRRSRLPGLAGLAIERRKVMARIFITGSTDGLGRAAARSLIADGHQVVLHARSSDRAAAVADLTSRAAGLVVGDLRSGSATKSLAEQVNAIGRMDAVIHNAGIYSETSRGSDR